MPATAEVTTPELPTVESKIVIILEGGLFRLDHQRFGAHYDLVLTELPHKGTRGKVRIINYGHTQIAQVPHLNVYIRDNILQEAKVELTDTFEEAMVKIDAAYEKAAEAFTKAWESSEDPKWKGRDPNVWIPRKGIDLVHYLKIRPSGMDPLLIKGTNTTSTVSWSDFSFFSPNSDFQQADPFYTGYGPKSATAARKFYKLARKNPDLLSKVSYLELNEWFAKNKISVQYLQSSWR